MPSATGSRSTRARSGVFISYARSDGEEFARSLRERLNAEAISLWRDREGMEGGRDWWLQITEALDEVEFMALVITPGALKSDTVRKEWRYARQEGVCIYPIKGTSDLDFDSLPRWMRSAHFYDLEREWQKFVNDLQTRCQVRRVPFMVEDLPKSFVPRDGEFEDLLKLLINEPREEPIAITAALKGAGGFGKTTLAKALCHDERIQNAFDDGILWVTLGENPGDLIERVKDLIETLSNKRPKFTTLDAAVSRLKELLARRDILMVIDDVWDRAHLNPFIQGGPRCARLITTRNVDTLPVSTARVQVDAMRQNEATTLLANGLDQLALQDGSLRSELSGLAMLLGEWPLLLQLVNSALRIRIENDSQSLRDAIASINTALTRRGLTSFDARSSDERSGAVSKTIGVSLDLLRAQERERYSELAIFPEDVEIPVVTLEKLWDKTGGLDEFETKELCSLLNRLSLLWSYDANRQRIRLHDVVRKFLIEQQPNKLPSIHAQLLDAHCPATSLWSDMSLDEPYLWDHLAHHLTDAGRGDELVTTVKDWRYLVKKTLIRTSLAVESDLLTAQTIANSDGALQLLRRNFVNSGHLLNRCETRDDIAMTLLSRLQHLDELKSLTMDLEQHLKRPCLVPVAIPDLPHPAMVRTLSGHRAVVWACTITPDGTTIVSVSHDYTLKVWDGRSGIERFTLKGNWDEMRCCAISADGTTIVSASPDRTLRVWDGRTGEGRFTLTGHEAGVNGCAISADGTTIVSASADNTLKVWDVPSRVERFTLRGHAGEVSSCAMSRDGSTIVSASRDGTLKVWDGNSGEERLTLWGHVAVVNGCTVSADGATIVSASADHTLKVWDGRTGRECFTLRGHSDWLSGCAVSADGLTIVSASGDKSLKVWDRRTGVERFTLRGHSESVTGCAVSADGATIVSASFDRTLKVWDAKSGAEHPSQHAVADLSTCAMSRDGATTVSGSNDGTLKVWDGRSGVERFSIRGIPESVIDCAVSADGLTIVSYYYSAETLKVWRGRNEEPQFTVPAHGEWATGCAVNADGSTIVSPSSDSTLKVWDGWSGEHRLTLNCHGDVIDCAVSEDGATILASVGETLTVWDGRSGAERFTLGDYSETVYACAMSADGSTIVSASADQTLRVRDGLDGAERFRLHVPVNLGFACAVSADGSIIVSASDDGSLKIWDAQTSVCIATLFFDGPLSDCACSADGEIIAAVGARGIYFLRLIR